MLAHSNANRICVERPVVGLRAPTCCRQHRDGSALDAGVQVSAAVAGMHQGVVEHSLLDLGRYAIGVRPFSAGQPINQSLGTVGLNVAADLADAAGISHQLASAAVASSSSESLRQ